MEFQIIKPGSNTILVSDLQTVERFSESGKRLFKNVPSPKLFRELAYLHPPEFVHAEDVDEAIQTYLQSDK